MSRKNLSDSSSEIQEKSNTVKTNPQKTINLIPKNVHQEEYLEYLMDPQKVICIATGAPGSGKTYFAMMAGIKALSEGKISKLILCRSVQVLPDEDIGFIPGSKDEKFAEYIVNLQEFLRGYYSRKEIENMLESGKIEYAPLAYMRGRNLGGNKGGAWVVFDEAQNTDFKTLMCIVTRLTGTNIKLCITGDPSQADSPRKNGLQEFVRRIEDGGGSQYISKVEFDSADSQRHPVVKEILDIVGPF
ncbi:PhoH-like protein [uncultured archaeon]|nr:PhoH-like protein [uncultured archaeon]